METYFWYGKSWYKEILESKYGNWRVLNNKENPKKESWWWSDIRIAITRRNMQISLTTI